MMNYRLLCIFLITSGSLVALPKLSVNQFGLRFGLGNENNEEMVEAEAMAYLDLDCCDLNWTLSDTFDFSIEPEVSLGYISGHDETAALVHLGFAALLDISRSPFTLVLSSGPTILTRHEFGPFDLGSSLQFTSAIGLNCRPVSNWIFGYRIQHTSNAGIDKINPGLDMHALTFAYSF